jgi:DnaK suppressor protein
MSPEITDQSASEVNAMRQAELESFKATLIELRGRILGEVQRIEQAIIETVQAPGDISSLPTHNADFDTEGVDVEIALAQNEDAILGQIDAALHKIEDGSFGKCESCGREIVRDRLKALPYAPLCIECARREEEEQAA